MGVIDTLPQSLLASKEKQPFLLVKLRLKQKDVDFSEEKVVLRPGMENDYKVILFLMIKFILPTTVPYITFKKNS